MDAAALEVKVQFKEGQFPGQRRSADQGAGGIGGSAKGRADVLGGDALAALPGTLQGGELDDGIAKMMYQIDAVTPAGVVHQPADIEHLAEIARRDQLASPQRLVEKAVIEDHGGFALSFGGFLQQLPGGEKVLFPHVRLAVPGDQGFFKKKPPRIRFEHFACGLETLGFPGQDQDGVWLPVHQGRRRIEYPTAEFRGNGFGLGAGAAVITQLDSRRCRQAGDVVLPRHLAGADHANFYFHVAILLLLIKVRRLPGL